VTPDPCTVAAARAALDGVVDDWMSRPGVVSVEVARRRTGDLTTATDDQPGAVVIRVTVHPDAPTPDLPDEIDGVPVEVIGGMPYAPE
jgi:hypothetical protein